MKHGRLLGLATALLLQACASSETVIIHNLSTTRLSVTGQFIPPAERFQLEPGETARAKLDAWNEYWSRGRMVALRIAASDDPASGLLDRTVYIVGRGPHVLEVQLLEEQAGSFTWKRLVLCSPTSHLSGPGGCFAEDPSVDVEPGKPW